MDICLNIENISKKIKDQIILNDISFSVEKRKIVGIKGRNGSGKSMLFKAIAGIITIDKGTIEIDGKRVDQGNCQGDIGALIEHPGFLHNYTGYENLKILASLKRCISNKDIQNTMLEVGLDPNDKRIVKKYSLGMRQKLGIAAAIMEKPSLIILDEPCNNLDIEGVESIRNLIRKYNKEYGSTVLIASHNVDDYEMLCSTIYEIKAGMLENIK